MSAPFTFTGAFAPPTIREAIESVERVFWWGRFENQHFMGGLILGSTVDQGNTPTDVLRPGLVLGIITATNKFTVWNPAATNGSEKVAGILMYAQKMELAGTDTDRYVGWIMVGGYVKAGDLLIDGAGSTYGISGHASEHILRAQMHGRFVFDDDLVGNRFGGWERVRRVDANTAPYDVTYADNGTLFVATGAGGANHFNLPAAPRHGLRYGFYNAVTQDLEVDSVAGTPDTITEAFDIGGTLATLVTISASANKEGQGCEVIGDGTSWLVIPHLHDSGTIAGA